MVTFGVRLAILLLVVALIWAITWSGRRFVELRRQRVLAASPLSTEFAAPVTSGSGIDLPRVHILAFSSDDCHQCHRLQAPALSQVRNVRGETVSITEIDAPSSPELAQRYQVLTVPTTVVLDGDGKAQAVNYGFANAKRLLEQIDSILVQNSSVV
jgi:hypothetical protein